MLLRLLSRAPKEVKYTATPGAAVLVTVEVVVEVVDVGVVVVDVVVVVDSVVVVVTGAIVVVAEHAANDDVKTSWMLPITRLIVWLVTH